MVSQRSADLLNLTDYGLEKGKSADIVIMDNFDPAMTVAEISTPLAGFKRGRRTFSRALPTIHNPS